MSVVSTGEIAAARADLASMLPDTCTIQRATDTSDGGGGQTTGWPEVAADVPCRLTPATGATAGNNATRLAGDRLSDQTTHLVTFPAGFDVRQGDRITVTDRTYQAVLIGDGGNWELARHVEARPV
jgi:Phage head-tail joining protein